MRLIGRRQVAAVGEGVEQELPAKDLRRLRLPQPYAGDGLFDRAVGLDLLRIEGITPAPRVDVRNW